MPGAERRTVADLGRGLGARRPLLAPRFAGWVELDDRIALGATRDRFDVIVALDAIATRRLAEFDAALATVRRKLVEGGLLLATFPAAPKRTILRAMLLDGGDDTPAPDAFHEVELQYRLQRAGLRGTVLRRKTDEDGLETLVCRAVRRADN